MKNNILASLFLLLFCFAVNAQETSDKNYRFIYIAHDVSTPINRLSKELRTKYREAIQYDDVAIFYLSSGYESIIVNVNTPNNDNREDFEKRLMSELQEYNSHDVEAEVDVDNILETISKNDFSTRKGQLNYASVNMDFYIGSLFWTLGNNESILSTLYTALDVPSYNSETFAFNVFRNIEDNLVYPEGMPFGKMNVNNINKKVMIFDY